MYMLYGNEEGTLVQITSWQHGYEILDMNSLKHPCQVPVPTVEQALQLNATVPLWDTGNNKFNDNSTPLITCSYIRI